MFCGLVSPLSVPVSLLGEVVSSMGCLVAPIAR